MINRPRKTSKAEAADAVYAGEKRTGKPRITVFSYDEAQYHEKTVKTFEECLPFKPAPAVTWVNIDGVHDLETIERVGSHLGLHPLLLEEIADTTRRPKLEEFDNCVFIILKMLYSRGDKKREMEAEQVSLVLGPNYVVSFQEREGDVFDAVRDKIRTSKGRIGRGGADYLAYCLLDAVVNGYFTVLELVGDEVEKTEEELIKRPSPASLHAIHRLKRDMLFLRKSVWPLREVINGLEKGESRLIQEATGAYLRDLYDHTIQVMDAIETLRDTLSGMLDIYLSSISNRMNEVMKVLTIIATIFMPLSFVAGVYGMNFKTEASPWNMPELGWRYGYPFALTLMLSVALSMLIYFKFKKWI